MATSAERMRAHRERARRRLRRLTVDVSEDDLRTLAERGYEWAASTDADHDPVGQIWRRLSFTKRPTARHGGDDVTSRGGVT